ncbi:DNA damage-regulated autophagy modulator protein 1 [Ochotona princeps]|uniref:DNA damage-regulated autophagy modulator protein 1 n=1 Tax=Ochotona princeps TaxID=9978 RepID=UPI0027155F93|nr:DNA damage-regulated autophagy modulator protein 1 [Ochotona princeps]
METLRCPAHDLAKVAAHTSSWVPASRKDSHSGRWAGARGRDSGSLEGEGTEVTSPGESDLSTGPGRGSASSASVGGVGWGVKKRWPRAPASVRPPLCDFTGFATSRGRPRPTHPGPAAQPLAVSLGSSRSPFLPRRSVPPCLSAPGLPPPPGSPQLAGVRSDRTQRPLGGISEMFCFLKGMAFVPFLLVTWSSAAFIISYVVAVLSGHVNPFLPYISDTGTTPPESGIFGFMINFSAFLGAATMYTRYKIVEKQNQTSYFSTPVFNLVSLAVGLVGCIGMGIVANFQELAVPVVHDGGALLAFVCGVIYTVLQSIISYKSCPQWNSLWTCHVRMVISAVSCVAVIPMIACASLISITKLEWNPKEKDYMYHVVSAICEWTVAFGFIFYFLTFIQDFQSVTLKISTEINGDV